MNYKLLCTATVVAALGSVTVQAEVKPYVGLELSHISADYESVDGVDYSNAFEDGFVGVNPYVGFQVNENFAVEAGYLQSSGEGKALANGTTDIKFSGFHVDAVGRADVAENVSILGSVGLARLKGDASINVTGGEFAGVSGSADDTDTALRLGVGAEYALTDKVSARGMVRYMKVDFDDTTKSLTTFGVGLNYKF